MNSSMPGPEVIKRFSYSTQLSTKFILLIDVKNVNTFEFCPFELHKTRERERERERERGVVIQSLATTSHVM